VTAAPAMRESQDPKQPGFYVITVMSSEQKGLTVLWAWSVCNLQNALVHIKNTLEARP
jgi:hypothetical protein